MTSHALPISIRTTPPDAAATLITATRPDGLPEGVHTGGAWSWRNEVWKPLDARPFMNADAHYPTQELECLQRFAGNPFFPKNWHKEWRNGRHWVVRSFARIMPPQALCELELLNLERAVRDVNFHNWEIGDDITIAQDYESYKLFILDLSTAHPQGGVAAFAADDTTRIRRYFRTAQAHALLELREGGREKTNPLFIAKLPGYDHMDERIMGYDHAYGSFLRPLNHSVVSGLPADALFVANPHFTHGASPMTWVITREPLTEEQIKRYDLTWAWSPLTHSSKENA